MAAIITLRGTSFGDWFRYLRGATVVYMIITAIVYQVLLHDSTSPFEWDNFVLHRIAPAFVVLWWFIWPSAKSVSSKEANWWLLFPILWMVYTLIRAAIINWYPYPFLNPEEIGGFSGVATHIIGITIGFIIISQLTAWVSRKRQNLASLY